MPGLTHFKIPLAYTREWWYNDYCQKLSRMSKAFTPFQGKDPKSSYQPSTMFARLMFFCPEDESPPVFLCHNHRLVLI